MAATLREEGVAGLQVTVSIAAALDREPHDVYLLEVALPGEGGLGVKGFDEAPILGDLEPLLAAVGPSAPEWVVDVSRTHRSDEVGGGRAQISLLLVASGPAALPASPDLTGTVQEAFARIGARAAASTTPVDHSHDAALAEARAAVVRLYPEIDRADLGLTDEEHHASEGSWSMGLVLPGVARFRVRVGLVPAVPHSVHVRRMPVGEVVDSVGT